MRAISWFLTQQRAYVERLGPRGSLSLDLVCGALVVLVGGALSGVRGPSLIALAALGSALGLAANLTLGRLTRPGTRPGGGRLSDTNDG